MWAFVLNSKCNSCKTNLESLKLGLYIERESVEKREKAEIPWEGGIEISMEFQHPLYRGGSFLKNIILISPLLSYAHNHVQITKIMWPGTVVAPG